MKKLKMCVIMCVIFVLLLNSTVFAQSDTYTVQPGDSMWKIAVKYQIGISELIEANKQIKNPALIHVGDIIYIPNIDDVKKLESEVVRLVNIERSKVGQPPLTHNWELSRVARYKSQDFINKNYFAHQSPTYGSAFDMMKNYGIKFTAAGENIAKGQNSSSIVMKSWMNSAGHRGNILSSAYNEIGVGVAKDSKGNLYWTQMFIKKK